MSERTIKYKPLSFQRRFRDSIKPKVFLSAGYGAGKTYSLCMKMIDLMYMNRPHPGGVLCPTLKMFKRDVLPTFKEILLENDIPYTYHKTDYYFYFPTFGSQIYVFHGEDHGASIRGPNLAWMAINEVTIISKDTFNAAIARVRIKEAKQRQIVMSGTPEGFNWSYEYFVENDRKDTDLIYGDVRLNTHIADDYVEMLESSYDKQLIEQYVEGKFVNFSGNQAVYAFDRKKHTGEVKREPWCTTWVSMDFNVNPMSGVLWQYIPSKPKHRLQAFDEIKLNGSNTYEFCEILKKKIGGITDGITIYPDPAGRALTTKTRGTNDFDILKQYGFNDIKFKVKFLVRNQLNALNNMFDKDMIFISKTCKNLIADLEQCIIKQGTTEIDKSDPKRTHWLDGLKNMVDYEFPLRRPRTGAYERRFR